jgi:hypothetical protein
MSVGILKRLALAGSVVFALCATGGSGEAFAAVPWWHVNTVSAPASQSGGENTVLLEVSNLGDAYVNGTASPVRIVDQLPAGVTPLAVHGELGGLAKHGEEFLHCSIAGHAVTCTYGGPLFTYERLMIVIGVAVEPGMGTGVSEVNVSGGGATPLLWRRALALSEQAPSFGAENYEITPEEEGGGIDTQAGSHPFQLTTTLTFNSKTVPVYDNVAPGGKPVPQEVQPVGLTKDLRFDLPPGLIGNPIPLPKCPLSAFFKDQCSGATAVGVASPIITLIAPGKYAPTVLAAPLYSLDPAVGEPARFGFLTPVGPVILDTAVRPGGDYGVVVTVSDIFDTYGFIGSQLTFWGVPADARHDTSRGASCLDTYERPSGGGYRELACPAKEALRPFLIMPTSCGAPLQSTVEGDSWEAVGSFTAPKSYTFASNGLGEPYVLDGCERLGFEPSISVAADGSQGSTPTGLTVGVHVDQEASLNPTGLADSTVKDTTVTLPVGVVLNPSGADGLMACGLGEIGLESAAEQSCPESAKVGTVEIETPLLPHPLVGAAYLASQEQNPFGSLIALYIVAKDPVSGVLIKLAGEVTPQEGTGQLVSTFRNTPPLPFEDLRLHFFGGSRAPLGTPALCGGYVTSAVIAPWSGNQPVGSSSEFLVTSGPNHAACQSPLPFAPELTTGSLNLQAGAFTPFTMTMSREDGQQTLQSVQLRMPPGLSGLLAGVELCPEPRAAQGLCGPGSLIGETTVSVGLGGNPYTVKGGKVYITGPYKGAPFGLSIVNPAKAGPFDLEKTSLHHPACDCLVVRAKIEVDPTSAVLTVTSDNEGEYKIPTMLQGIPLEIKHVNVTINRPGFTFNPTDCEPSKITGALQSTQGSSSTLAVPFQVTNCATLGFKPGFSVSTSGKTSRQLGASLHVKLTYPKAAFGTQANIKSVKVDLPKQLPSRLTTLQKACADATFNQNPAKCPAASRVGMAKAITPLIPVPLEGPAYFVSHGGAKFPELIVVLQGYGVTIDLHGETFIDKTGITSSTFHTIPDAPVGSFELTLPQGSDSALAANGNLCKSRLRMPTAFTAQNGAVIKQSTPITATGCAKKAKAGKRGRPHGRHGGKR